MDAAAEAAAQMRKVMTFEGLTIQLYESAEDSSEVICDPGPTMLPADDAACSTQQIALSIAA